MILDANCPEIPGLIPEVDQEEETCDLIQEETHVVVSAAIPEVRCLEEILDPTQEMIPDASCPETPEAIRETSTTRIIPDPATATISHQGITTTEDLLRFAVADLHHSSVLALA